MKDAPVPPLCGSIGAALPRRKNPSYHVLMVDDDKSVRLFCVQALFASGYQVHAAEDGAAAWDALQINSYHLLITDHGMPKVTGIELLKKLHDAHLALPVIMATGTIPEAEFARCPWLLPDAVLLKPYTIAELLEIVKEVLLVTNGIREWIAAPADGGGQPAPAFAGNDDSKAPTGAGLDPRTSNLG
jgi:CheY-like chemotaxis protein